MKYLYPGFLINFVLTKKAGIIIITAIVGNIMQTAKKKCCGIVNTPPR